MRVVHYAEDWADRLASVLGSFGFAVHEAEYHGVRCYGPSGSEVRLASVGIADFPLRVCFPAYTGPLAELGCKPADCLELSLYDLLAGVAVRSRSEGSPRVGCRAEGGGTARGGKAEPRCTSLPLGPSGHDASASLPS